MYQKFASKCLKISFDFQIRRRMLSSWDSANQFPLRILGKLSWNICHRRWSLLGRQRLPDFCYHRVKTQHSMSFSMVKLLAEELKATDYTLTQSSLDQVSESNSTKQHCFADSQQFWFSSTPSRLSWNFAIYYFRCSPGRELFII